MPDQTIKPVAVIVLWESKKKEPIAIKPELLAALKKNGINHVALLPLCPPKAVSMAEAQFVSYPGDIMKEGISSLQDKLEKEKFILLNNFVDILTNGQSDYYKNMISTLKQDLENQNSLYRYIVLDGLSVLHVNNEKRFDATDMDIMIAAKALRLRVACENYLKHLKKPKSDANIKLTQDKEKIVTALLEYAKTSTPAGLQKFGKLLKNQRAIIEARRDSNTRIFLKVLLSIFTFGIAAACGLWKKEGEKVTHELNSTLLSGK